MRMTRVSQRVANVNPNSTIAVVGINSRIVHNRKLNIEMRLPLRSESIPHPYKSICLCLLRKPILSPAVRRNCTSLFIFY